MYGARPDDWKIPLFATILGGSTMGIHVTDDTNVALYDSVSGFAFGPTFESADDALSFCKMTEALATDDPRKMGDDTLQELFDLWHHANEAGHGTVLWDGAGATLQDGEWIAA